MSHLHEKHYSLAQARNVLQDVVPIVEELTELKQKLDEHGYDINRHQYFGGSGPNGERVFPPELIRLVELAQILDNRGILVKGLGEGLIDFPHIRSNDEEVYLCWKLGETDIHYWHRIPDGYAGRRPITEL